MADTKKEIVQLAETLIRTKGYQAFSYADIAVALNVKNAAVHYHYPTKEDLGCAVVQTSIDDFHAFIIKVKALPYDKQLLKFMDNYVQSHRKQWVCLMGALAPAFETLPASMQEKIKVMGKDIQDWVQGCLANGKAAKVFSFEEEPEEKANLLVSSILAALILQKILGKKVFTSIHQSLIKSVTA